MACSISVGSFCSVAVSKPTTTKDSDQEQETNIRRRETYGCLCFTFQLYL